MNDPMSILNADHREAKKLLIALAESDERPKREKTANDLNAALTLHMQIDLASVRASASSPVLSSWSAASANSYRRDRSVDDEYR